MGVFFPPNGKFYAMGGRSSDSAGSDFMHPFEYDAVSNTWTTKSATYPDNQVNNMACGRAVAISATPNLLCRRLGSRANHGHSPRVLLRSCHRHHRPPSTGGDNWPGDASGTILPGGFALSADALCAQHSCTSSAGSSTSTSPRPTRSGSLIRSAPLAPSGHRK